MWVKKIAPPPKKTFCNIFTQVKYISVKFCPYVASLYLHIFSNFVRFILIFNSFQFQVSPGQVAVTLSPIMSGLQIRPTSIHRIFGLGGNARVSLQTATEAKNRSQVYRCTLADLVCLAGESHWQCCESHASFISHCSLTVYCSHCSTKYISKLTAGMCVSQQWKFWTCNVTVSTNRYYLLYLIICHLMLLVFLQKIREFCNKLNWIQIWGIWPVKMINFTQIFR